MGLDGVVLVGHGGVPRDFPRADLARLKALEAERRRRGAAVTGEEEGLETRIRTWPRTAETDPYQAGLEALARELAPLVVPARLVVAYNEFCAPTVEVAVTSLVEAGARRVSVVPSMLTPGGIHSEVEIPETIAALRRRHPEIELHYAWPFDLRRVAGLLAGQVALRDSDRSQ